MDGNGGLLRNIGGGELNLVAEQTNIVTVSLREAAPRNLGPRPCQPIKILQSLHAFLWRTFLCLFWQDSITTQSGIHGQFFDNTMGQSHK